MLGTPALRLKVSTSFDPFVTRGEWEGVAEGLKHRERLSKVFLLDNTTGDSSNDNGKVLKSSQSLHLTLAKDYVTTAYD